MCIAEEVVYETIESRMDPRIWWNEKLQYAIMLMGSASARYSLKRTGLWVCFDTI